MNETRIDHKKTVAIVAIATLFAFLVGGFLPLLSKAGSPHNKDGTNFYSQNYSFNWAAPIKSYLVQHDNGFMRLQAYYSSNSEEENVFVEYYDKNWHFVSSKDIPQELPIFGAFYEAKEYYYLLTGQNNMEESSKVECYRVTKYDKNWKRIASAGIYDCDTFSPFSSGRAEMAEFGNELVFHTAHRMYKRSDGNRHQSNDTHSINTDTMTYLGHVDGVYVSHSFDQFLIASKSSSGDPLAAFLDLGDGYPRALHLTQITFPSSKLANFDDNTTIEDDDLFPIYGDYGDNRLYLHVGGFEESSDTYLTTFEKTRESNGTYIDPTISTLSFNKKTKAIQQFNLFVNEQINDPKIIKIDNDRFLVIWSVPGGGIGDTQSVDCDMVYYQEVDKYGKPLGEQHKMIGHLSDCQPTLMDQIICWYSWDNEDVKLYCIDANDITKTKSVFLSSRKNNNSYSIEKVDGKWAYVCNGTIDTTYSGVAKNEYGWWRVKNGYVDFNANGIYKNQNGWWKTTNGKVTFKETGVFKNEYGWWRVKDSKVDFKANGIYKNQYGWWKTTGGKVTFKENGVFKNEYGWWKVKYSKVDFSFTGIAKNKYGSWYVKKGKVDFSKSGKVNYNGTTYTVKNGKVQ